MNSNPNMYFSSKCAMLLIIVSVFAAQLPFLLQGEDYVVGTLTNDDTYYYLQTAWNSSQQGLCSFDGIEKSNGVQMLWYLVLVGLSYFVLTKSQLLIACMLLCFLLNAVSAGLVYRVFCPNSKWRGVAVFMTILWCSVLVKGTYWLGLENSLHATVAWVIILLFRNYLEKKGEGQHSEFFYPVWLSVLLILNVYIRLDSAVISAVLFSWVCVCCLQKKHYGLTVGLVLASVVSAVSLFAGYYAMGKTIIPVSGMVKQLWGVAGYSLGGMLELSFPEWLPYRFNTSRIIFMLQAVVLVAFGALVWLCQRKKAQVGVLSKMGMLLIVANGMYCLVYYLGDISYAPYYRWYRSWQYVGWLIMMGVVLDRVGVYVTQHSRLHIWRFSISICSVLLCLATIRQGYAKLNYPYKEYTWYQRYNAAKWLSENLPDDAIIGAWNAGQVGYFSRRTTINLDGLINSKDYYKEVLDGAVPLSQYLATKGVDFLFDYPSGIHFPGDLDFAALDVEKEFERVEFGVVGEPMVLWRMP